MQTYLVTVEVYGLKTYKIAAESPEEVYRIADRVNGLDNLTNPVQDSTEETIKFIDLHSEPETKTEIYKRLRAYIQDITENQEPLELLERLKP